MLNFHNPAGYRLPDTELTEFDPVAWEARILFFEALRQDAPQVLQEIADLQPIYARELAAANFQVVDPGFDQALKDYAAGGGGACPTGSDKEYRFAQLRLQVGLGTFPDSYKKPMIMFVAPSVLAVTDWAHANGRLRDEVEGWMARHRLVSPVMGQLVLALLFFWTIYPDLLAGLVLMPPEVVTDSERLPNAFSAHPLGIPLWIAYDYQGEGLGPATSGIQPPPGVREWMPYLEPLRPAGDLTTQAAREQASAYHKQVEEAARRLGAKQLYERRLMPHQMRWLVMNRVHRRSATEIHDQYDPDVATDSSPEAFEKAIGQVKKYLGLV